MDERVALLGGIYSNHLALAGALRDARRRGAARIYCLGDLGAFGPHPDRVFPLLAEHGVECVQGNYDHSIGNGLDDCRCGYTDPRDNHYARLSYEYTLRNTSPAHREVLRALPAEVRFTMGGRRVLLCHGSPRRTNEFLWESTTPDGFLERLFREHEAEAILATHTGLKWKRLLPSGRLFVNVGVLGRPENDGTPRVWYTLLTSRSSDGRAGHDLEVEFVPVDYDHGALAAEMRDERLPEEFVETVLTGWWTTCLEVLPSKERARGRY
jgi:diadenosine tetraphosphatase ApaH/serine/threonine PP2A family protein phosphatase